MLSAIVAQFKGFFNRAFWFGNFLPVFIVAMVHALLVTAAFPETFDLTRLVDFSIGESTGAAGLAFALLVALAYLVIPFVNFFHGLLDGTLLPGWAYDALRRERLPGWRASKLEYTTRRVEAADAQAIAASCRDEIYAVRAAAGAPTGIADTKKIEAAEKAVGTLRPKGWATVALDRKRLEDACGLLVEALQVNTTNPEAAGNQAEWAVRLDAAHAHFDALLSEVEEQTRHAFNALIRRNTELDLKNWEATRLGDIRRQTERYPKDAYHVEFAWIWPRLTLVLGTSDTGICERLTSATAQRDFAVLLLFLVQSVPLVWLPLLLFKGGSPWLILAIGWSAPVATIILYELVIRSEILFGTVVATAIDRHRVDLLTTLHQRRPPTLQAERLLWRRLVEAGAPGNNQELVYAPGGSK